MSFFESLLLMVCGFLLGVVACWNIKASVDRQDIVEFKFKMDELRKELAVSQNQNKQILGKIDDCELKIFDEFNSLRRKIDEFVVVQNSVITIKQEKYNGK